MKLMFLTLSMVTSFVFTQMNHPLAMGLMLLIQTILIAMITGLMSHSFWFSYILFLIFLGGMLVLFIYVTSLASNEMFTLSTPLIITTMLMTPFILILLNKSFIMKSQETLMFQSTLNSLINLPLIKLYNLPTNIITIILASYLFLTLIAVVKITNIFIGPLRQMN
uniref:NADH-ubiquinone oxidoreductase chain 6 n=3 Tax=Gromphadorhina TaxID=36952 RepID=A0A143GV96_GROPO|nr:NADH dehydrogenase subunit 6 [Gromphadorhina portentosa]AMW91050.1 NADH dehydrogenase subunit 6 [Gromphadorhina portentosa]